MSTCGAGDRRQHVECVPGRRGRDCSRPQLERVRCRGSDARAGARGCGPPRHPGARCGGIERAELDACTRPSSPTCAGVCNRCSCWTAGRLRSACARAADCAGGRSMRRTLRILAGAAGACWRAAGAAFGLARHLDGEMDQSGRRAADPVRMQVVPGRALRRHPVALQQQGALRHARLVEMLSAPARTVPRLQAGTYEVPPHASARAVLEQFESRPRGARTADRARGLDFPADARAHSMPTPRWCTQLRGLTDAAADERRSGTWPRPPEGRFFPDTYRFAAGTSDRRILELAYERMQAELAAAWRDASAAAAAGERR